MLSILKRKARASLFDAEGVAFVRRFNMMNALKWRFPIRVEWHPAEGLYSVCDGSGRLYFARRERVFRYYRGIADKLAQLGGQYFLSRIPITALDIVIDCGANVGEFGREVQSVSGCRLISIEPELREVACLTKNVPANNLILRTALWNTEGPVRLYTKNASGDSSLISPSSHEGAVTIQATTLHKVIAESGSRRIKLLKLDVEGAEPEVLAGAGESLSKVEFITADLGFERGIQQTSTAVPVINLLYTRGFQLLEMSFDRVVCLFRNTNVSE